MRICLSASPSSPHGRRAIVKAMPFALVVLGLAVLPAAYDIDPLGTGDMFGLTGFAQTPQTPLNPPGGQPGGPPITPKPGGPLTPKPRTYKVDVIEFLLTPNQFVEYKYELESGDMMMYVWKADGPLDIDFHTVPEGKPLSASETFERGVASEGQGMYRAPYKGLHGWYWKNTGKTNVKIVLNTSGFYTGARMFSGDPVGEPMEVQDPPPPPTF